MVVETTPAKILSLLRKGMPIPATGQTLIMKNATVTTTFSTIHTVTTGKTFYLMGVHKNSANNDIFLRMSFDGGTTEHAVFELPTIASGVIGALYLFTGWPMAQIESGENIQIKGQTNDGHEATIWGWEE